jgi:cytochrome c oxidase subunit 2
MSGRQVVKKGSWHVRWRRWLVALGLVGAALLVTGPLLAQMGGPGEGPGQGGMMGGPFFRNYHGPFSSNGQRIYFTAESDSGRPITYTCDRPMGPPFLACVTCHGPQGEGGKFFMFGEAVDAPDISWPELSRESDPPYTVSTLVRAITQGLDNEGKRLDPIMPRWTMAREDLTDLVGFVKTLQ